MTAARAFTAARRAAMVVAPWALVLGGCGDKVTFFVARDAAVDTWTVDSGPDAGDATADARGDSASLDGAPGDAGAGDTGAGDTGAGDTGVDSGGDTGPPDAGPSCTDPIPFMPPAIMPRCQGATQTCVLGCASGACINACLDADGFADGMWGTDLVNCRSCTSWQRYACMYRDGCGTEITAAECCIATNCPTGAPACVAAMCGAESRAVNDCGQVYASHCYSFATGPRADCFAPP